MFRFRRCPGQARMAKAVPRDFGDTSFAAEGTLVHELLECALLYGVEAAEAHASYIPERWADVSYVVEYLEAKRALYPDLVVESEHMVYFPQNIVPPHDCCGSADVVWWSPLNSIGGIVDYKNGFSYVADPELNDQLWFYATAAFWGLPVSRVVMAIVQPNGLCAPVREHEAPVSDIYDYANDLQKVILAAESSDAKLIPGSWCGDCSVGTECSARERDAIEALTEKPGPHTYLLVEELGEPEALDVNRMAAILAKKDFIIKWLNDLDSAAYNYAAGGGHIPGRKLVEAAARRRWAAGPRTIAGELEKLTGLPAENFLETDVIGIAKAESAIKQVARKAADPDAIRNDFAALTVKQSSGNLSLVSEDDKRPAYNPAASVFGTVIIPE